MSRFVTQEQEQDRVAWSHFCTGHHVEFLYWEATALACERVVSASESPRWPLSATTSAATCPGTSW